MWSLYSSKSFLTKGQETNMHANTSAGTYLVSKCHLEVLRDIASIQRDSNIPLKSHITVLNRHRYEVWITQWFRAVAWKRKTRVRSIHLHLTYPSSLRILFSSNYFLKKKKNECSQDMHRYFYFTHKSFKL